MKTRIISGIGIGAIMAAALFAGGWILFGLVLVFALIGMFELYRVIKMQNTLPAYFGYVGAVLFYIVIVLELEQLEIFVIVITVITVMTVYVFNFKKYKVENILMIILGLVYVAVMMSYIYKVRIMEDGLFIVWLIFIASWVNDTCAYFTGVTFGKRKMCPELSPKKSIEGAIGGIAGATILGGVYGFIISDKITGLIVEPVVLFAVASCIGALLAIVGDLAASAIKRSYEIKDYGKLIPGHGGIMDRFDSVIFTAPAVYWAVFLIECIAGSGAVMF